MPGWLRAGPNYISTHRVHLRFQDIASTFYDPNHDYLAATQRMFWTETRQGYFLRVTIGAEQYRQRLRRGDGVY